MPDAPQQPLKLELQGNEFLLSRIDATGNRSEMSLSQSEVISLITIGRLEIDRLLEQRRRGTKIPRLTIPVAEAVLNTDLHKTVIALVLIDPDGHELGFVIQPDTAARLVEILPKMLAEIEAAHQTRQ